VVECVELSLKQGVERQCRYNNMAILSRGLSESFGSTFSIQNESDFALSTSALVNTRANNKG